MHDGQRSTGKKTAMIASARATQIDQRRHHGS
jgi:hypothetical protein